MNMQFAEDGRHIVPEDIGQHARRQPLGGNVRVQVTPVRSAIDVPAGSFYVPLNQPLANLAVAALEPDTQNSYFANRVIDTLEQTARIMTPPSLIFEEME